MQPRKNAPRKEEVSVNKEHREDNERLGRCEGVSWHVRRLEAEREAALDTSVDAHYVV